MITPGQLLRLVAIQRALIRHGADELVFTAPVLRSIRFVLYLFPWNWRVRREVPRARRIRNLLEELGPIYVKVGQLLSTRRDLLPDDIAIELAGLQDRVPPFPGDVARRIVEQTYGAPVTDVFSAFDEQPLASASIAQVHAARLRDGSEVVVKVVRPGIRRIIERDLGLIRLLAQMAERYWPRGRELQLTGVVAELRKTILDELDLMREAANAAQLRRNFTDSPRLYVPEVHWPLTRRNVLVMERIEGIRVDDRAALEAAGVDRPALARAGVEVFFTQVFRDHYFHADMHPGNLFVRPASASPSGVDQFMVVDFGIMGSLSDFDQRYLAENFVAFMRRDYRRVAQLHVESGWVPRDTRVDEFEFAIRAVCEPIFDRPIGELSVGELLLRLFQTAQRFHMKILPQLLLLQKTLINVEGVGRELYPQLDLWAAAGPVLEEWMRSRTSVRRLRREIALRVPAVMERLPDAPAAVLDLVERGRRGELEVRIASTQLDDLRRELVRGSRRIVWAIAGAGLILGATVLVATGHLMPGLAGELGWLSAAAALAGVGALGAALRGGGRT